MTNKVGACNIMPKKRDIEKMLQHPFSKGYDHQVWTEWYTTEVTISLNPTIDVIIVRSRESHLDIRVSKKH